MSIQHQSAPVTATSLACTQRSFLPPLKRSAKHCKGYLLKDLLRLTTAVDGSARPVPMRALPDANASWRAPRKLEGCWSFNARYCCMMACSQVRRSLGKRLRSRRVWARPAARLTWLFGIGISAWDRRRRSAMLHLARSVQHAGLGTRGQ
jgi:hypothetical protein